MITNSLKFKTRLNYSQHNLTDDDRSAVMAALDSNWIAGNGPISRQFAEGLCEYTGYKYAILTNSATTGLYVALMGDSSASPVTMPNLTFVATGNAALFANRNIQPHDVDFSSLTTDGMKIGVSFGGYPVRDCFIADEAHGLRPHMTTDNNFCSILSTHAVKQLTTGEGGVILTNDLGFADFASGFIDHGRGMGTETGYGYGMNWRMAELNAALGLSQLERAYENSVHRQRLASIYLNRLRSLDDRLILPQNHHNHAWHLFLIRFQTREIRDDVKRKLDAYNVGTQIHYPPLTSYSHINARVDMPNRLHPNSFRAYYTGLSLPLHNGMTDSDVFQVCCILEEIFDEYIL